MKLCLKVKWPQAFQVTKDLFALKKVSLQTLALPLSLGIAKGAYEDTAPSPMRMNHPNPEMFYKYAVDTMRERAHVGSASWVEAPSVLSEFVEGAMSGDDMPKWEYSYNSGGHMNRPNVTVVYD